MLVYRIVSKKYSSDLLGTGAGLYGGRWNPVGTPLLYTSHHRSLSLCEMMVGLTNIQIQQEYDIIEIFIPDEIKLKKLTGRQLPQNWNNPRILKETQLIGRDFVSEGKYLGMQVPSVIIPEESNFVFNPLHKDFSSIKLIDKKPFAFDKRLF